MISTSTVSRRHVIAIASLASFLFVLFEMSSITFSENYTVFNMNANASTDTGIALDNIDGSLLQENNVSNVSRLPFLDMTSRTRVIHSHVNKTQDKDDSQFIMTNITVSNETLTATTETYTNVLNTNSSPNSVIKLPNRQNSSINVILNAYMRSGSSFTGRLFSLRPDTFYTYEPLWRALMFQYYNGSDTICKYSQPGCYNSSSLTNTTDVKLNKALEFLLGLMNCTFNERRFMDFYADLKHFQNEFPTVNHDWRFYKAWGAYIRCTSSESTNFSYCLDTMVPVCLRSKFRVSKVLRNTLDSLDLLIKTVPNLKIIQLFRDPRAIINSRINTRFYKSRIDTHYKKKQDIKTMCNRMEADFKTAKIFLKLFPDRFRIVQYEDLLNLNESVKLLYAFVGMPVSTDVMQYVSKLDDVTSGLHPYKYMWSLNKSLLQFTNKQCKYVISELGYPQFNTSNVTFNALTDIKDIVLPFALSNTVEFHLTDTDEMNPYHHDEQN